MGAIVSNNLAKNRIGTIVSRMPRMPLAIVVSTLAMVTGGAVLVTLAQERAPVTFHKQVEPILQKNCQGCHRPGQIAPMSLLTYQDARP